MTYAGKDENLAMWHMLFMKYGHPANPYTAETRTFGRRIVFTADYENIKAILATQFNDYGKGENFNREWKPFLGDSACILPTHRPRCLTLSPRHLQYRL